MARPSKRAKRALRRSALAVKDRVAQWTPAPIRRRAAPLAQYLDMLLLDHLVVRVAFPNRHRVTRDIWRAAQPLPHQVHQLARQGIRTIVNLRGLTDSSTYALERQACARHGIKLVDYRVRSRDAPTKEEILGVRELLANVEYPMLMHCKSGSDRAGLMSVIVRHIREGTPIEEAKSELSLRYGHFRQADTGILDYFFERYIADNAKSPIPFFDWVETVYDPEELKRNFRANGWANRLVNGVLRRE